MSIYVFLIAYMVTVILVAWVAVVWLRRRRWTRARFAFAGLAAISSLVLTGILALAGGVTPWEVFVQAANQAFELDIPSPHVDLADRILIFLLVCIGIFSIRALHRSWDGELTEGQYRTRFEHISISEEGIREILRIARREPPEPSREAETRVEREIEPALHGAVEPLAWHQRARELIELKFSEYYFDRLEDWHEDLRVWIGVNRHTNASVVLHCPYDTIAEVDLDVLAQRTERRVQSPAEAHWIIATRDSEPEIIRAGNQSVDIFTEATLLQGLVDFTDYFDELQRRIHSPLPDSTFSIADVYVTSDFSVDSEDHRVRSDVESYIHDWIEEHGDRQLAVLGEYGQGKSTLALMLAHKMIEEAGRCPDRVPILIELRGMSPRNLRPEEVVALWCRPYGYKPNAIMTLVSSGRAVVILEGFDEMELIGSPIVRLDHFRTLWKLCYPGSKILITGRPNFFLDNEDLKRALGVSRGTAAGPYTESIRLAFFDSEKIRDALRPVSESTAKSVGDLADSDSKFKDIVSRPSLLYIVGQLWERENLRDYQGRLTSAYLTRLFVDYSYTRQTEKAKASGKFMVLNQGERSYFMRGIAAHMVASQFPNQIESQEFADIVTQLMDSIPEAVSRGGSVRVDEPLDPLSSRLVGLDDPVESVMADVAACGILVSDLSRPNSLKFAHKSFMEFLAADVVAERVHGGVRDETAEILRITGISPAHIASLTESAAFLADLLTQEQDRKGTDLASWLYDALVVRGALQNGLGRYWTQMGALSYLRFRGASTWWEERVGLIGQMFASVWGLVLIMYLAALGFSLSASPLLEQSSRIFGTPHPFTGLAAPSLTVRILMGMTSPTFFLLLAPRRILEIAMRVDRLFDVLGRRRVLNSDSFFVHRMIAWNDTIELVSLWEMCCRAAGLEPIEIERVLGSTVYRGLRALNREQIFFAVDGSKRFRDANDHDA